MRSERFRRLRGSLVARGWRTLGLRTVILCVGWWALNEGELAGALGGAVIVMVSLAVSAVLTSTDARWQPRGLVELARVFLVGSIRGGIDVARRALGRSRLSPTMIRYPVRLSGDTSRNLFMGALSLMPGTLSVILEDRDLEIHLLVDDPGVPHLLERIERAIARAVGESLEAPHA